MIKPRLVEIMQYIEGDVLADIGTDHGYLPIEAVTQGFCKRAIACDIRSGPLGMAEANIRAARLSSVIETRLGDGLKPLKCGEADSIVISGMGGTLIWKIINDNEKAKAAKRLILQPQHDIEGLRKNLHSVGFEIFDEKLVFDSRFYVILVVCYTGTITDWAEKEYFLGKHIEKNEYRRQYFNELKKKLAGYIHRITDEKARKTAENQYVWLEEELCRKD